MNPNTNPYDFLNDKTPAKKSFAATTKKGRIIQVVVIAALLFLVFGVLYSLVLSKDTGPKTPLLQLSAAQTDLIELTALGEKNARDSALKTQSQNILLTVTTQNKETNTLLASYGVTKKLSKATSEYRDTSFKPKLETALQTNTFDDTYRTILSDRLGAYRAKLKNAYSALDSTKQKTQLSDFYGEVETLNPAKTQ